MLVIDRRYVPLEKPLKVLEAAVRRTAFQLPPIRYLVDRVGFDADSPMHIALPSHCLTGDNNRVADTEPTELRDETFQIHFGAAHAVWWVPSSRLDDLTSETHW
jgi:hypothetical protein